MSGGSSASALSVSYSLTANSTTSTRPIAAGSPAACDAREMDVAVRAVDAQAARAHRVEMRAAREERDVGARRGEPAAEIAADAAGADDRDPHEANVLPRIRADSRRLQFGDPALIGAVGIQRIAQVPQIRAAHSYRSASIGSTRVARRAGR